MTVLAVTFDGVRLDDSDDNTDFANLPTGGQAGAAESNLQYQGVNTVNQKLSSETLDGISYAHPSTTDMTATARKLFYAKQIIADFGQVALDYGASFSIGLDASNRRNYNCAGSGAKISRFEKYPALGGYLIAAINPSVSGWIDNTTGTVAAITAIDFFVAQGKWLAAANSKAENFGFDAIDIGTGLTILSGTGADPAGKFTDFVAQDQDVINNRWGVCFGAGPLVRAQGQLTIGASGTATEFDDDTSTVLFLDGYVAAGDNAVIVDIGNASSVVSIGCSISGLGAKHTEADTRPDHTVLGTSGTYALSGTLGNHRNIILTSGSEVTGDLTYADLTVAGAHIHDGILRPNSVTQIAACDDQVFGTSSGVHDCAVVQAGVGHAFEISGDETLTNINWSGFGANASNDAAIFVNTTSPVTITIDGGNTPTYRTIGTDNVTIDNPKILTIEFNFNGVNPANFEWRLYEDSGVSGELGTVALAGAESKTTFTDETYGYTYTVDTDVVLQIIATGYEEKLQYFTLGNANQTQTLVIEQETNL